MAVRGAEVAPGYVDFGTLAPDDSDGRFVEVQIRSHLISMAARLAEKQEPDIAAVLRNLQYVRVNVIGLNEKNSATIEERLGSIAGRLEADGWERVVEVREGREEVRVRMKTKGDESVLGVVVMVVERGREAVLVNVVGDIRPEQLALVGERFDIEPLRKLKKRMAVSAESEKHAAH